MESPKAYSYVRFSTPEQAGGDSLRRQTEASQKWAADHGYTLDDSLTIRDLGVSAYRGTNINQGLLGDFLELVKSGKVANGSVLIVESLDRITRQNVRVALTIFLELLNNGVDVVTIMDGEWYKSQGTGTQDTISIIKSLLIFATAHEESEKKSKRTAANWEQKRKNGIKNAKCPAWLKLDQQKNKYEIIPEKVAIVKRIFKMVKSGRGIDATAKILNQEGVPTFRGAKFWRGSYIRKLITQKQVLGEFQPMRHDGSKRYAIDPAIPDYFPRIIDDATWHLCNQGRTKIQGRIGENTTNLFTGVCKCGLCGSPMRVKGDGERRTFVCDLGKHGKGCSSIGWNYSDFEQTFLAAFPEIVKVEVQEKSSQEAIASALGKHQEAKKKIDKLNALLLDMDNPPKSVIESIKKLEDEADRHAQEAEKLRLEEIASGKDDGEKTLSDLDSKIKNKDFRFKLRRYIQSVTNKIDVYPEGKDNDIIMMLVAKKAAELKEAGLSDRTISDKITPCMNFRRWRYMTIKLENGVTRFVLHEYKKPTKIAVFEHLKGKGFIKWLNANMPGGLLELGGII